MQSPLIDTRDEGEVGSSISAGTIARLLFTAWGDLLQSIWNDEAVLIPAMAPPGEFGMLMDSAAYESFETLVTSESTYRNAIAARSIFTYDDFNPAKSIEGARVPIHVVASREDRFVTFSSVEALIEQHDNVTLTEITGDHFDVYTPPQSESAFEAQVTFLERMQAMWNETPTATDD